jgi:ketosteroid isomerase-like protein
MDESASAREAWLGFCERLTASDADSFDDFVAADAKLIIGTAPGEWVEDRPQMRFGFETEGFSMRPGEPTAYEEGSMAWVADEPTIEGPDGSSVPARLTAVMRMDGDRWKIVHAHFSVGVPDDEVVTLTLKWSR